MTNSEGPIEIPKTILDFFFEEMESVASLDSKRPAIYLEAHDQWGAKVSSNYRQKIRERLFELAVAMGVQPPTALLTPGSLVTIPGLSFSISHSPSRGAFAICVWNSNEMNRSALEYKIGLDIEESRRVHKSIVERISAKEEVAEAPSFDFLWCAKESSLKAVGFGLISDVSIREWRKISVKSFGFKFEFASQNLSHCGFGAVWIFGTSTLAVSFRRL